MSVKSKRYQFAVIACLLVLSELALSKNVFAEDAMWWAGFAKVDVTPEEPLRLSGYANRVESSQGVADPLHARAMVLSPDEKDTDHRSVVLVSVDSICVTNAMTVEIAEWLDHEYHIHRSQIVLSSTHSHAAPHLAGGLTNLFREPLTDQQTAATFAYTRRLITAIKECIRTAMQRRVQARLSVGETEATFAVNRRLLKDGVWSGFGVQEDGAVDHRMRWMRAVGSDGKLIGAFFLYACHCTTMGGDFNQISGDWAGLAAGRLENRFPGAVFLPIIGCGADANPNPRGSYDQAQQHAAEVVDVVSKSLESDKTTSLTEFPIARFGYAGLSAEMPTDAYLQQMASSEKPNERRWHETMKSIQREMGRLPESYPMPIHTWHFGDFLTCVFLGGEVVVDYQLRIEKELPTKQTWVAAYCDDVFAYVASEKMRSENGYEVDFSMIYYAQPGRWQSGTQASIIRRVREIFENQGVETPPLSLEESFRSIRVPDDYQVELVASEPLVQDPINIGFDPDGSVWVVEMADYPLGAEDGGRIRKLWDSDGDGRLDQSSIFCSGLSYPTSVQPWRGGVLVVAAPHILFFEDRDGDDVSDFSETLVSGLNQSNPQHRANGFELGLDGRLHFGLGTGSKAIESIKSDKSYKTARSNDMAWNPDSGEMELTSGATQFVRSRDAFGNWFGNSNSEPMFQYVIESRYLSTEASRTECVQHLLTPSVAPPVYPRGASLDRFNDLHTLNRFTSACSSIVNRVPGVQDSFASTGFICEPVHNLVARVVLEAKGATLGARRHPDDKDFDFFTSTDPWCRPVRAINAPDGTLWIVDMVRKVVEHPEWIPTSWQSQLDLQAGSNLGRIYRVYRKDFQPSALRAIDHSVTSIVTALRSSNGAVRDMGLLRAIEHDGDTLDLALSKELSENLEPAVYVSIIGAIAARNALSESLVMHALNHHDPRVIRYALELSERIDDGEAMRSAREKIPARRLGAIVDLQWVLTSMKCQDTSMLAGLLQIAARSEEEPWVTKAISLVPDSTQATRLLHFYLDKASDPTRSTPEVFTQRLSSLEPLWNRLSVDERLKLLKEYFAGNNRPDEVVGDATKLLLVVLSTKSGEWQRSLPSVREYTELLWSKLLDERADIDQRAVVVGLIGSGCFVEKEELAAFRVLLSTDAPTRLRLTALEAVRRLNSQEVATIVCSNWTRLTGVERSVAGMTLLARADWCNALIEGLESKGIAFDSLDQVTVQQLRDHRSRAIRSRAIALLGRPTPTSELVGNYLQSMPSLHKGDMGATLYRENCVVCHEAKGDQKAIGPPLQNLKHWTLEQWVVAILDPSRNVEAKYLQTVILTDDDQAYQGVVIEESETQVRLVQGDGTIREIPATNIAERRGTQVSLMPAGLEKKMSPQQLSELIAYLRQLSSAGTR